MWDAIGCRKTFSGPDGYQRVLTKDIDELRAIGARWGYAHSAVLMSCGCYFCGLDGPGRQLAEFAERLLVVAFKSGELDRHNDLNHGHAYNALALARWILNGQDDAQSLAAADKHYRLSNAQDGCPDGHILDFYLPDHLNASGFDYVCKRFEQFSKTKVPKNLKSIRYSRVAAYVWAQYKLATGAYTRDEAHLAVRSFLDNSLDESLLSRGLYSRAGIWLKIAYWSDTEVRQTPRDILRKAYEHMPEVAKPF